MNALSFISNISLYIPHVFKNIDEARIAHIFDSLLLGKVSHVDFVPKTDRCGKSYNAVYVHFNYWYNTVAAANFQEKVRNPEKEARLVYDEPWYWVVLENKSNRVVFDEQEEENELDEILDQMEECEQYMQQIPSDEQFNGYTAIVALDYVLELERDRDMLMKVNKKQVNTIEDLEHARFRHSCDSQFFERERDHYLMVCDELKECIDELTQSNNKSWVKWADHLEHENRLLTDDKISLSHEVAYLRELLAQYEPSEKNQDKEMYH
jgi:glutamate/tyrosine decarboxylase-like PLP-dependent enzyme